MKKKILDDHFWNTIHKANAILSIKNADYGTEADALSNFRSHGAYGVLVRLGDKITRLNNLYAKAPSVISESEDDSIMDAINYLVIYSALRKESRDANLGLPETRPGILQSPGSLPAAAGFGQILAMGQNISNSKGNQN